MTALAKEEKQTKKRGAAEVDQFLKKYNEALEQARVSAEHTGTEGWQGIYQQHQKNVNNQRKYLAERLHSLASAVERGATDKETCDAISECKKELETHAGLIRFFERRLLDSIKEPMNRCQEIIEQTRREARDAESGNPLTCKGMMESIKEAIDGVEKVTFDDKTGRIVISKDSPSKPA